MEIVNGLTNNQLFFCVPIIIVVIGVLVFTFGFKSPEQPPFDKLTIDDRKPTGKKRKIKEKKGTANGHVSTGDGKHEKSPSKESKRSPAKEPEPKKPVENNKQSEKNKKNEAIKNSNKQANNEEAKNKKNLKKQPEKPVDFDDGDWEIVPSKADKKKKQDLSSPAKKDNKKSKKIEKNDKVEIEKLVKEVANQELRDLEKDTAKVEVVEVISKKQEVLNEQPIVVVEEKKEKEKKKEKKQPKVDVEKVVIEVKENVSPKETPKVAKVEKVEVVEVKSDPPKDAGGIAFDELGDVWTEAKAAKKSKKKARRDN